MYADVIIDISSGQIDKSYQYRIPDSLLDEVSIGVPVSIPFGSKVRKGFVVGLSDEPKLDEERIKPIRGVEKESEAIEKQMIELAFFIRENFGATMNAALHTVLPVKRKVRQIEKKTIRLAVSYEMAKEALAEAIQKKDFCANCFRRESFHGRLSHRSLRWGNRP